MQNFVYFDRWRYTSIAPPIPLVYLAIFILLTPKSVLLFRFFFVSLCVLCIFINQLQMLNVIKVNDASQKVSSNYLMRLLGGSQKDR